MDEKKTQHAGLAFDVNSSLICVQVTDTSEHTLQLTTRRISHQIREDNSVLLLEREKVCALVLPATPFSGAQALVSRVALLLHDVPCELQVYHGATALLILQHLYEAGATSISHAKTPELTAPGIQDQIQCAQTNIQEISSDALPYLAFLTNYPSPGLLQLFPYELARRYQCVPVGAERNMLTLATCHWLNREVVTQLRIATHRGIFQVRCELTIIDEVLRYWQRLQETTMTPRVERDEICSSSS